MTDHDPNLIQLPRWGTAKEAAAAYGIAARTLRHWATRGKVKRRGSGADTRYLLPPPSRDESERGNGRGMPRGNAAASAASVPHREAAAVELLRSQLEAANGARIDAERRAAVAEYRATIAEAAAEITPDRVELLQAEAARAAMLDDRVAMLAASLDEARREAEALGAAMRKRYALIQRLAKTARSGRE